MSSYILSRTSQTSELLYCCVVAAPLSLMPKGRGALDCTRQANWDLFFW